MLIKNILEHEETKTNNNVISLDPFAGNGITINIKRVTKDNKIIIDGVDTGAMEGSLFFSITGENNLNTPTKELNILLDYIEKLERDLNNIQN